MHLQLDDEIMRIERRIAARKRELGALGEATGRRALERLTSPLALAGAVALGFAVGGLGRRREKPPARRAEDSTTRSLLSGVAGLLASGAMWFIRAQYGGPAGLARALTERYTRQRSLRP